MVAFLPLIIVMRSIQFPTDIPIRKMQGGGTVRTWDIPPEAERLSYYIRTNGRPLKALVELVRYVFFSVVTCIESICAHSRESVCGGTRCASDEVIGYGMYFSCGNSWWL